MAGSYVPWATEAFQEGLRIPPIRVFSRRGPERGALEFILGNLRGREEREGDLMAQYAANEVAARRLTELFERYGTPTVLRCFDRFREESERQMRDAIRTIPPGMYEGEDFVDDDGIEDRVIPVRVRVTIDGDRASFDFTGTGEQAKGLVNTTQYVASSAVYYSLKALIAPNVVSNDGCYLPI